MPDTENNGKLFKLYRKIGVHAAPKGTLLFWADAAFRRVFMRRLFGYISGDPYTRATFGAIPYYNVGWVRRSRTVNGLALVFFMGAGDYLMTTPFIRALRMANPDLPIYAYGSSNSDNVNSPMVIQLLKVNPLIDKVFTYRGRPREYWTDYDFSDALKDIPQDFVILPVIYDTEPVVYHRATALLETFCLPVDVPVAPPIAYPAPLTDAATQVLESIRTTAQANAPRGIVFTHFGARSSGYEYPHVSRLVERLAKLNYLVISFSKTGLTDKNVIDIDVTSLAVTDSIELIRAMKAETWPTFMVTINSLMWPISAALNIPNLGLHIFHDQSIHQYLYPNIFVVTQYSYPRISPSRWFQALDRDFELRQATKELRFTDYRPDFVMDCFETMVKLIESTP